MPVVGEPCATQGSKAVLGAGPWRGSRNSGLGTSPRGYGKPTSSPARGTVAARIGSPRGTLRSDSKMWPIARIARRSCVWWTVIFYAACRIEGGRNGGRGGSKRRGVPGPGLEQYEVSGAVKLVVAPGSVAAGQRAHFRVDNSKGPTITYGAAYRIQECMAGVWMLAPFSPTAATRQRICQRRGRGRWWRAPIPATAAVGRYRIRKLVEVEGSGRWLYGDFDVIAHTSARRTGMPQNPAGPSPTEK